MQNAAAGLRATQAVASFDTSDHLAAYGLKVANPAAMQLARSFVSEAVLHAVSTIDAHLDGVRVIGQNPYLERLTMGSRTLRHAAPVEVFAEGVLASRFERAFAESGDLPRPDMSRINERILHDLSAHVREHGFAVAASESHGDGTLSRIALIDPVYVEAALARQAAPTSQGAPSLGSALTRRDALPERGIANVTDPRVFSEVENAVQRFAAEAIVKVGDYLRDVVSAGGSPFVKTPNLYQRRYCGIVDRARVKRGGRDSWRVPESAVIPVMGFNALKEHFDTLFQGRATFESDKLGTYIATVIAKRMQSQPDLGGALVALGQGSWIKDEHWALVAVCAPAPAPGIFAFVRQLFGRSPPRARSSTAAGGPCTAGDHPPGAVAKRGAARHLAGRAPTASLPDEVDRA